MPDNTAARCFSCGAEPLTVGVLRESLVAAMDLGGAYGQNLGESKGVLLQVGDDYWPLERVKVSVRHGLFVLVLEAGESNA
jgi:hypothetical protein